MDFDALGSRQERAEEVKATYRIEQVGPLAYFVQHPSDDERAYLVDLAQGTCECMDFTCRNQGEAFYCKHMLALSDQHQIQLPARVVSVFTHAVDDDTIKGHTVLVPDNDDPYRD